MQKRRIAIYSGSFNPIHLGHAMLADYIAKTDVVDEVWLMVTPLNPLKQGQKMENDAHRLAMARLATKHIECVEASDFEFSLPQPTFTYATLCRLSETYPDCEFRLVIGSDNWLIFEKWRNWQEIIDEFGLLVYPRPGYDVDDSTLPKNVRLLSKAPVADISSTEIRSALANDGDTTTMLHPAVKDYIISHDLYCD